MIYFSHITNPFQPNKGRIDNVLDDGKTVWDMVREQKVDLSRPTICMIDGAAVLRKLKESDLDFICNTNVNHIPGNISLSFKGISGETLMHRLDLKGIMVSTGSACDSAKNQTSHVIKALGVPEDYAYGTIRISLGKENTEDEIEEIFIAINEIVKSLTV